MKQLIFLVLTILLLTSCQDVIDVELPQTDTKLVVNALIRVDLAAEFIPVSVSVAETSDFFGNNEVTKLENAVIFYGVPNPNAPELFENLGSSSLAEIAPGSGIYEPDPNFSSDQRIPTSVLAQDIIFVLVIEHKGRRYSARSGFTSTVNLNSVEQEIVTFFGEEQTELTITISDSIETEDYYVFDFGFSNFLVVEDEFFNGQQFSFSYFYDESFETGTELDISILGADKEFANYIDLILEQTENNGGVFQTPAATVRGNIFDVTGLDNVNIFDNVDRPNDFALGYFAVVQEFKQTIIIE